MTTFSLRDALDGEYFVEWEFAGYRVNIAASNFFCHDEYETQTSPSKELIESLERIRTIERRWRFIHGPNAILQFHRLTHAQFRRFRSVSFQYLRVVDMLQSPRQIDKARNRFIERARQYGGWLVHRQESDDRMYDNVISVALSIINV